MHTITPTVIYRSFLKKFEIFKNLKIFISIIGSRALTDAMSNPVIVNPFSDHVTLRALNNTHASQTITSGSQQILYNKKYFRFPNLPPKDVLVYKHGGYGGGGLSEEEERDRRRGSFLSQLDFYHLWSWLPFEERMRSHYIYIY